MTGFKNLTPEQAQAALQKHRALMDRFGIGEDPVPKESTLRMSDVEFDYKVATGAIK